MTVSSSAFDSCFSNYDFVLDGFPNYDFYGFDAACVVVRSTKKKGPNMCKVRPEPSPEARRRGSSQNLRRKSTVAPSLKNPCFSLSSPRTDSLTNTRTSHGGYSRTTNRP